MKTQHKPLDKEHYNAAWYMEMEAAKVAGWDAAAAGKPRNDPSRPMGEFNPYWKWGHDSFTGNPSNSFKEK